MCYGATPTPGPSTRDAQEAGQEATVLSCLGRGGTQAPPGLIPEISSDPVRGTGSLGSSGDSVPSPQAGPTRHADFRAHQPLRAPLSTPILLGPLCSEGQGHPCPVCLQRPLQSRFENFQVGDQQGTAVSLLP